MGGRKGRLISLEDRCKAIDLLKQAISDGARMHKACAELDITLRTFERWQQPDGTVKADQRLFTENIPSNKLTEVERRKIISIATSKEYRDLPPHQIVPKMADQNEYVASESTFYRILKEEKLAMHRGRAKPKTRKKPEAYIAKNPNEIWSWDITYLKCNIKGAYFYLYLIMDIFSRKIVGYEVYDSESAENASEVATHAYRTEKVDGKNIILHSDNGSPMKGATMLATLQKLGVTPSFSRPSVSNDNPYSESLFKTLKYCPKYPDEPFDSLQSAREWVYSFVQWYNNEHFHSNIKYVTPVTRHQKLDENILENRKQVYERAKDKNPSRWSRKTRNWDYISEVHLNPGKTKKLVA